MPGTQKIQVNPSRNIYLSYDLDTSTLYGDQYVNITLVNSDDSINYINDIFFTEPTGIASISPNPFTSDYMFIDIDTAQFTSVGDITVVGTLQSTGYGSTTINIYISIYDSSSGGGGTPTPPTTPVYGEKYRMRHYDADGNAHRVMIGELNYTGETIGIAGTVNLKYQERKDINDPIISLSLSMSLEANTSLSLTDLYSEKEQNFKVQYYRNAELLFVGFIKPDGVYEDWVSDRWVLDIDCIDSLSTLKNMGFLNEMKSRFFGKLSILECIKYGLKRGGLDLPINVNVPLSYIGYTGEEILGDVYVNSDRFYQEAESNTNKEVMDCDDVIRSLLNVLKATMIQMNGEWWIFRAKDLADNNTFYKYDGDNVTSFVYNASKTIGSQINGATLFHCDANQKKSISASTQVFRIYYKYGNVKSVVENSELKMNPNVTADGWLLPVAYGTYNITNQLAGYGYEIKANNDNTTNLYMGLIAKINQTVNVYENDMLSVRIDMFVARQLVISPLFLNSTIFTAYIETDNFVLDGNLQWVPKSGTFTRPVLSLTKNEGGLIWNIDIPAVPENSELTFQIDVTRLVIRRNVSLFPALVMDTDYFKLNSIEIMPSNANIKGYYYTANRSTLISTKTKEDITVYNGDSNSDLFIGTLYKDDKITPTSLWKRNNIVEERELLAINAIDALEIAPKPIINFEGSVYGFMPYLSKVTLNDNNNEFLGINFQPTEWSYSSRDNKMSLKLTQYYNEQLVEGTDYTIEPETDYGDTKKVTIKA